jgi:predicted DNA-binding antitoxin AbrB/MazE fold protein
MTLHVNAIYEHGVLKPLGPLELNDREIVSLSIEKSSNCDKELTDDGPTLFDLLDKAGLIGCINDGPPDLSTNPKYMEDFGKSAT